MNEFCLHDIGVFDRKAIFALSKSLKKVSEKLKLPVIKKVRLEYDPKWPINHYDEKLKEIALKELKAYEQKV